MRAQDVISLLKSINLTDYRPEYDEAMGIAIYEVSKLIPRQPITRGDGLGCIEAVCPNCGGVVYHSDWFEVTQRKFFETHCLMCRQRFTPKGKYIGDWEPED